MAFTLHILLTTELSPALFSPKISYVSCIKLCAARREISYRIFC